MKAPSKPIHRSPSVHDGMVPPGSSPLSQERSLSRSGILMPQSPSPHLRPMTPASPQFQVHQSPGHPAAQMIDDGQPKPGFMRINSSGAFQMSCVGGQTMPSGQISPGVSKPRSRPNSHNRRYE